MALTSTPGKMIGLLLAVGLLVIAVLFAITRAGSHEAPQPPQPLPATSQEAESEARILQEAQERFQQKNLEGAHSKLKELAENAAARESPEFKQIEDFFRSRPWGAGVFFPVCGIEFLKVMGHEKLDARIIIALVHCLLYGEQCGRGATLDFLLAWLHVSGTEEDRQSNRSSSRARSSQLPDTSRTLDLCALGVLGVRFSG